MSDERDLRRLKSKVEHRGRIFPEDSTVHNFAEWVGEEIEELIDDE